MFDIQKSMTDYQSAPDEPLNKHSCIMYNLDLSYTGAGTYSSGKAFILVRGRSKIDPRRTISRSG